MRKKKSLGLLIISLLTTSSFAREISLEEAIQTGLQNNYEVKASEKMVKSKEYAYQSAKGYMYPSLTFSEMFMRTNEPGYAMWNTMSQKKLDFMTSSKFVDMTALNPMFSGMGISFAKPSYPEVNSWRTKLELQVPIYTGGKISSGIEMSKRDYESAKNEYTRSKEKAIYDISKAYYGALLAKEAIKLANQAYKDAEKHYQTAQSMVKNGLAIPADELRAKVYMSEMSAKIKEAENNYLVAKRGLLLAMGLDKADPSEIDVVGNLVCENIEKPVEEYQNYALSNRSDLLSVREKIKMAQKYVDFNKADLLPTIGAFASYELNDGKWMLGNEGKWWMAGVALNWKIFDGFQSFNKYKSAKEMYDHYKQQEKGFEEFIKFNVYKAYKDYLTSKEKLKTEIENVKYAEEILKVTETRYKNQLASMIDLLDTQTMFDKIKFDKAQAEYNCQLSVLELKYQSGLLIQENQKRGE
ncbi:TolC family protein [Sulfurihydrogenibium subterraneum]|uniref:TolC family protein n=1 Tax=Sulfurihydrogenibium subterraneum TaxID=171121 RepID=UPI00048DCF05|nr:TolC family protein [Sulfurihydrogenibium subterraneum]